MFSIRVHPANHPGHSMHECREYEIVPNGPVVVIRMRDGEGTRDIELTDGGLAFIMGDSGKTVEVVRSRPVRPAQLRGA